MATTRKDLEVALERLGKVARRLGYNDVDSWHIYCAYGNKYWLYERAHGSESGVSGLFMADGWLGVGTGAAASTLHAITRTLEDVEYRTDPNTRPERKLARLSRWSGE